MKIMMLNIAMVLAPVAVVAAAPASTASARGGHGGLGHSLAGPGIGRPGNPGVGHPGHDRYIDHHQSGAFGWRWKYACY
jgi:hypothetical protein